MKNFNNNNKKKNPKSRLYVKLGINKFELTTSMITLHIFSWYLLLQINGSRVGLVTKLCLNLMIPWTVAPRLLCPWNFPCKNIGVSCHFLLQGIFLTEGSGITCIAGGFFTTEPTRILIWRLKSKYQPINICIPGSRLWFSNIFSKDLRIFMEMAGSWY